MLNYARLKIDISFRSNCRHAERVVRQVLYVERTADALHTGRRRRKNSVAPNSFAVCSRLTTLKMWHGIPYVRVTTYVCNCLNTFPRPIDNRNIDRPTEPKKKGEYKKRYRIVIKVVTRPFANNVPRQTTICTFYRFLPRRYCYKILRNVSPRFPLFNVICKLNMFSMFSLRSTDL